MTRSNALPGERAKLFAEFCALLMKQPRTIPQLARDLGTKGNYLYRYVRALRDEGLVYICQWERKVNGPWIPVWAWQPSVAELQDAPKPVSEYMMRYYMGPKLERWATSIEFQANK